MHRLAPLVLCLVLLPVARASADATVDCGGLQDALTNQPAGAVVTLEAGTLCGDPYTLPDHALTLRGEDGAGFQPTGTGRSLSTEDPVVGEQRIDNLIFKGNAGLAPRGSAAAQRASTVRGGGMTWQGDSLVVSRSTFTGINTPDTSGGGLFVSNEDDGDLYGSVTLTDDTFTDNRTEINGGGARLIAATVTVDGTAGGKSLFRGNTAGDSGGGLAITMGRVEAVTSRATAPADPDATVTGTTFDGNTAAPDADSDGGGGGLFAADSATNLADDLGDVITDRAGRRAADPASGQLVVGDNVYTGNHVATTTNTDDTGDRSGGGAQFVGIRVSAGTEIYRGNTVAATDGEAEGGGISLNASSGSDAEYTGENTVVVDNTVTGSPTLNSEQVAGAGELPEGGGIYLGFNCSECATALTLTHATVTGNRVTFSGTDADETVGAGIQGNSPTGDTATIDRSIVYGNTADVGAAPHAQISEAAITVTNSDDEDLCGGALTDGNVCAQPVFAAAGAPIQAASSPTVDALATTPLADDFLHAPRPSPAGGRADMGAHELQPAAATATATATATANPTVTASPPMTTPAPDDDDVADDNGKGRRKCGSRRSFRIKLRRMPGTTFVSARFRVNGKRVKTIRFKSGRLGARINLRTIGRRTIKVKIRATTSTGAVLHGKRIYHPCYRGKKKHTTPKL